jgi:hypothetical protein
MYNIFHRLWKSSSRTDSTETEQAFKTWNKAYMFPIWFDSHRCINLMLRPKFKRTKVTKFWWSSKAFSLHRHKFGRYNVCNQSIWFWHECCAY